MCAHKTYVFHFHLLNGWYTAWEQQRLQVTPPNFPVLISGGGSSMVMQPAEAVTISSVGATATTVVTSGRQVSSASVSQKQKTSAGGVKRALKLLATLLLDYLKEFRSSQLLMHPCLLMKFSSGNVM